jgi:antitoxin YefM
MIQLTITQARQALLDLPQRLAEASDKTVSITRHGRPVLALLPWELYDSIIETLEVLGDPRATAALRSSLEDIRKRRLVSRETAVKHLGGDPPHLARRLLRQRLVDR